MKKLLPLFFLALVSCNLDKPPDRVDVRGHIQKIDPTVPPDGPDMFAVLIENATLSLRGTKCADDASDARTLKHKIADLVGKEKARPEYFLRVVRNSCHADGFDGTDIWLCSVTSSEIEEKNPGENIGPQSIVFGVTRAAWRFVPEVLMCW